MIIFNIANLGFDPNAENKDTLTQITEPTQALKAVYTNLYLNTRNRLSKLDDFLTEIDSFLTKK